MTNTDIFINRIKSGLIGPGSDCWGLPDEEEIISDYPLQRYFSAILFPEKSPAENEKTKETPNNQSDDAMKMETSDDPDDDDNNEKTLLPLNENEDNTPVNQDANPETKEATVDEPTISQSNFNPNNIGLTFCTDAKNIDVVFNFGIYYQPKPSEIKIKIDEQGYQSFFDKTLAELMPFPEKLRYENGFMFLEQELEGSRGGRGNDRNGEYVEYDKFKRPDNIKGKPIEIYIDYLERLIGRTWKRENIKILLQIETKNTPVFVPIEINAQQTRKDFSIAYNVKTYTVDKKNYVRVQLINTTKHPSNKFPNKNELLNNKCLFQASIKIKAKNLLPYQSPNELNPIDKEANLLNFLFREVNSYGIGHNCSVVWDEKENFIETTFLPNNKTPDTKNNFTEADFKDNPKQYEKLNDALNINNLSDFSKLNDDTVIQNLFEFVHLYREWIEKQKKQNVERKYSEIKEEIIKNLESNCNRLNTNVELLRANKKVFRVFKVANTAMLIQIIISLDDDFAKKPKELSDLANINRGTNFDSFDFFKNYDYERLRNPKSKEVVPHYRPFQLAFLLLSIEGIVNSQSPDRNEKVDLIWFPTGGGKTEAYLAVAAFDIIWRQMNNEPEISKGVAVIMRYTLRLLTAQQFERASRLIASLAFMQKQKEYKEDILKGDVISIGLWVGSSSTPNKIEEAIKSLDDLQQEFLKRDKESNKLNGNPDNENKFQISACPWCGTKLYSKVENLNWLRGFDYNSSVAPNHAKQYFKINCINNQCTFHNELPVQVVDEMLYEYPPTLLFATVDKFARLAWESKTYKFFNQLNEALPPDLIIQDELHLLSGPLGSIVGLYENLIELLCTKTIDGKTIKPKVIASTATTRNTSEQIKQIYRGKNVNVFPPSGLSYEDSFFSKIATTSRRTYIGFMPVGKTAIDTQLQVLAHLFTARLETYIQNPNDIDNYWTIVSYYNSLKDVGKINNKVSDEITTYTALLQHRLLNIFNKQEDINFNYRGIAGKTRELTSRIESPKIKAVLEEMGQPFKNENLKTSQEGNLYLTDVLDLVLATNMFSVGIDIGRLNAMLINGMPKNIAEYIQASSRVGRAVDGLVLTLLDPNRARDKSYFEHFVPFHQAFYKSIEPLSVTPFTENTIDKMITTMMIAYLRNKLPMASNDGVQNFIPEHLEEFKNFIKKRFMHSEDEYQFFENKINRLSENLEMRVSAANPLSNYINLLVNPANAKTEEDELWATMNSLRDVDTNSFIQIIGQD
jgi:hypothetical protein